jgi:hypothetical protein
MQYAVSSAQPAAKLSLARGLISAPMLVFALALLHGLLYAYLVPPWQAPDEPTLFEYAALVTALGRVPSTADADPQIERRIVDSLSRHGFFERMIGHPLDPPAHSMREVRAQMFLPRQVGSDPPLYFVLAAPLLGAFAGASIETQLLALRLLGAVFVAGAARCAYGAAARPRCCCSSCWSERSCRC